MDLVLSHNTIRLYLAGIQHFLSLQNPKKPSLFAAHTVKAFLRGIQKCKQVAGAKRLPISSTMFRDMSAMLSRSTFGFLSSLGIKAAIYLAFYGFLHPGEFTYRGPNSQIPCMGHLSQHQDHFVLHLTVSKAQQAGRDMDIKLFQTLTVWCRCSCGPIVNSLAQQVQL